MTKLDALGGVAPIIIQLAHQMNNEDFAENS